MTLLQSPEAPTSPAGRGKSSPALGPWTTESIPDQTGRIAVVTGASSGLGLETARALAAKGATVVMACRSIRKAEEARAQLLSDLARQPQATHQGALDLLALDLADLSSVRAAAATFVERYGALDLLINNA
ncbi:MAG: SDR family NAD(P)-dependent oxidoreductase, partial [Cyanobium sp.]